MLWTDPDVLFETDIDGCSLAKPRIVSIGAEVKPGWCGGGGMCGRCLGGRECLSLVTGREQNRTITWPRLGRLPPLQTIPGTVANCGVMYFNLTAFAETQQAMLAFGDSLDWKVDHDQVGREF